MAQTKEYRIAVLKGDGIGPEVMNEALQVLEVVSGKHDVKFKIEEAAIGGIAIDTYGEPLPEETIKTCLSSDAVLLGAVGGPKWDNVPGHLRPEAGLLKIRSALGLYANLRPAVIYPALMEASPLKKEIIEDGIDIMVVRELTGGMYFGEKGRGHSETYGETAFDTEKYSRLEVERIARLSFEIAGKRGKKVMSVDKANVLESSRLWREVVLDVAKDYPNIELSHMYVDNAAMQLVRWPAQFDVIVTSNMFGDILSDEASMITGSIGMLPSASIGEGTRGLYEPIHGSAPDIAGKDLANPIATILSLAMMMKYSLSLPHIGDSVENAVKAVLNKGLRTGDIRQPGMEVLGTRRMGEEICKCL